MYIASCVRRSVVVVLCAYTYIGTYKYARVAEYSGVRDARERTLSIFSLSKTRGSVYNSAGAFLYIIGRLCRGVSLFIRLSGDKRDIEMALNVPCL